MRALPAYRRDRIWKKGENKMQKEAQSRSRSLLIVLAGAIGIVLFGFFLMRTQYHLVKKDLQDEMKENSSYIREAFSSYEFSSAHINAWSDENHFHVLRMIGYMMQQEPGLSESADFLEEMRAIIGSEDLMVVDRRGNILTSASGAVKDLKDDVYAPLFETFETGQMTRRNLLTWIEVIERFEAGSEAAAAGEEGVPTNMNPIFYALALDDDRACVIDDDGFTQMLYSDATDAWSLLLDNEVIGSEGFAFAWSRENGEILYYPGIELKGRDIAVLGMDMTRIRDGEFVEQRVNGQDLYLYPVYDEAKDAWIACAVPMQELSLNREGTTALIWAIFAIMAVALTLYATQLLRRKEPETRQVPLHTEAQRSDVSRRRKLLVFTVFCCVVFAMGSFYLQMLYQMSRWADDSNAMVARIEDRLDDNQLYYEGFREYYNRGEQNIIDLIGWYIGHYPEKATSQTMDELSDMLLLSNLHISDKDGNVTVAESTFELEAAENQNEYNATMCNQILGEGGGDPLFVSADYYTVYLVNIRERMSLSGTISAVQPGMGGFAFAVNADTRAFSWFPDASMIGKSALDYGMKEGDLHNHLCTFIQLNRKSYYAVSGQKGDDLIYVAILKERLLRELLPLTAAGTAAAFVILLLIALPLYTLPEAGKPGAGKGRLKGYIRQRTEERRAFSVMIFGVLAIGVWFLLSRYVRGANAGENILDYAISGNWEYGANIFALTASLILAFETGLCLLLIRMMARFLSEILSVRSATGVRMLTSLVSYAGVLFIGYRCLVFFGIDPSTLMASAGIISVVIGIGANSLVGDIIAGVFLLMEGNIRVGDIVCIGDFRGRVEELGIRMTKLYDIDNHVVKIIPNKEVQNVVHMSMHPACLRLEFQITYEESLERVEGLLVKELAAMEGQISGMIGKPIYKGVRRLDDNGVVLAVDAFIHEENRLVVNRGINRRVYMMFCKNGIEVPFPQLTVHSAGDAPEASPDKPGDGAEV